ncbi:AAA family ATPase [Tsukamurella tyrosinosolvens]|uniref:AAA family ATPase n=1 Tax=Tsukamurella tyrosinosolvens TaxID=57704 RepID=UPI003462EA76
MTITYGTDLDDDGHPVDSLLKGLVNGAWLDAQVFPPLEQLVPGILTEGFGFIVGPPKAGKSWFVGNLALACASGGRALGQIKVDPRPVLYLALEDGHRRLQDRFRTLTEGQPLPARLDLLVKIEPGQLIATVSEWLLRHQDEKPLVILDTFGKGRPQPKRGDNPYLADYQAGTALKDMIDAFAGASLLAVHHSRKAESDDFLDAVSGTQGLAGSADYILVLTRKRQSDEGALAITGRDVTETEIAMVTTGGRWALAGSTMTEASAALTARKDAGKLGDQSAEVLALVKASAEPVSPKDVADKLGINNDTAGKYLRRLSDGGRVRKAGRGTYVSEPSEVSERDQTKNLQLLHSDGSDGSDTSRTRWLGSGEHLNLTDRDPA